MRVLDAALRECPAESASVAPPPTAAECGELRERRAALIAAGKGANHPARIAIDVRLDECADGR